MTHACSYDYREIGLLNSLIHAYLGRDARLQNLYGNYPDDAGFAAQIQLRKQHNLDASSRKALVTSITSKYQAAGRPLPEHLELLSSPDCFTVVTGHQLNLFTGPAYFIYKIMCAVALSRKLKQQHPSQHFIPVYWMASEDHDLEEIQFFNQGGTRYHWEKPKAGAVGQLDTEGLQNVYDVLAQQWRGRAYADELLQHFRDSYLSQSDLAGAHLSLVDRLLGDYGVIILDGDCPILKKQFAPIIRKELTEQFVHAAVEQQIESLSENFKVQVAPRELNLFYLQEGKRDRIIQREGMYFLADDETTAWTQAEILEILDQHPERFSPNVLLRPIYQEYILPNLCYLGGGGELSYWFELKSAFGAAQVPFPILLLRNAAIMTTSKHEAKREKLNLERKNLFQSSDALTEQIVRQLSKIDLDFTQQREHLKKQFAQLYELAAQTDASFTGAVAAQEKKQLNGLDNLEKRLLRAQKRKLTDHTDRALQLRDALYPSGNLQERELNFSEFYLDHGSAWLDLLLQHFDPTSQRLDHFVLDA